MSANNYHRIQSYLNGEIDVQLFYVLFLKIDVDSCVYNKFCYQNIFEIGSAVKKMRRSMFPNRST